MYQKKDKNKKKATYITKVIRDTYLDSKRAYLESSGLQSNEDGGEGGDGEKTKKPSSDLGIFLTSILFFSW